MSKKSEIKEICQGCGREMAAYEISITPGIMNALRKLIRSVREKGINEVHLVKDTKLTHNEINNITRLRFHGLVAKCYETDATGEKKRKSGYWLVTKRAADFIKGEIELPVSVTVFNDRIVSKSETMVTIAEVMKSEPYFDTIEDIRYHEVHKNDSGQMEIV